MLDLKEAHKVIDKAATTILKKVGVRRVLTERRADSDGNEALAVTVVIKRGRIDKLSGELSTKALLKIWDALEDSGDDRIPLISFTPEEEMESSDDTDC
jgi:hypothetical protein